MSWSLYRWTWLLESPLYIGITPAGSLNRCRLYIPARTLWAAVTAELARHQHKDGAATLPRYQEIGEEFRLDFRFTYLYPAEKVRGKWQAWLPRYERDDGLVWRREDHDSPNRAVPNREFRLRLLHTRASTAIEPVTDAAAEGSLRETESVQTRWRDEEGRDAGPVAFAGYVLAKNSGGRNGIKRLEPIESLFVGGDTRYGLGRLKLVSSPQPDSKIFGQPVRLDAEDPIICGSYVLAHTSADGSMCGALEALSGWNVGNLTELGIAGEPLWVPGSKVAQGEAGFLIDGMGVWHLKKETVLGRPTREQADDD